MGRGDRVMVEMTQALEIMAIPGLIELRWATECAIDRHDRLCRDLTDLWNE